jgi:hypothetical protein
MPIFISFVFFWFFMNSYKFGNFQKYRYFFSCQEIKLQGNAKKSAVICPIPTFVVVVVDVVNALQSHMIVFFLKQNWLTLLSVMVITKKINPNRKYIREKKENS